ncbi:MAG: hypothetical protein IPK15_22585 [Verrucomicrobia bacterium]|nr:hypothetical protein [Verrucomicrobiota bacterium]
MNRHRLFLRGSTYYRQDSVTGQQLSLRTKDRETAERLIHAFNEAHRMPEVNLQIAKAYLTASDPAMKERTWLYVMEEMGKLKRDPPRSDGNTPSRIPLCSRSIPADFWKPGRNICSRLCGRARCPPTSSSVACTISPWT